MNKHEKAHTYTHSDQNCDIKMVSGLNNMAFGSNRKKYYFDFYDTTKLVR